MRHLQQGYVLIAAGRGGSRRLLEHVAVAEAALGKRLPKGAIVHHHDEDKTNNDPRNLVICPNRTYHNLLHQRMRALKACGNADWLRCCRCKRYDAPANVSVSGGRAYHKACNAANTRRFQR